MTRRRVSAQPIRTLMLLCITTLALLCTGCFNRTQLSVSGPVEYSLSPVDASKVITCDDEDAKLEMQDDIVASHVGTQTITVKIGEGLFAKTEDVEVQVVDTQAPVVTLEHSRVEVEMGGELDPRAEIGTVEDPVDGALEEVDEAPEAKGTHAGTERFYREGWWLLEGEDELDLNTPGTYELTVRAVDLNGNETREPLTVEVTDPLAGVKLNKTTTTLEYAKDEVRPTKLVTCSIEDAKVRAKRLSLAEVGAHKVTFTITKGASTKHRTRTFKVVDTQAPTVTLEGTEVTVEVDAAYDPIENVIEVTDPVDGVLEAATKRPKPQAKGISRKAGQRKFYDEGWYLVTGTYDLSTIGSYPLEVLARDQHGNTTKAAFTLNVVDPLENAELNKTTSVLEYAQQDIDPTKLVTCSVEGATIEANYLSLREVGKAKVTYIVSKGASSRTFERTFEIRDTKAPVISLGSSELSVENGASFDRYANVVSVIDPVDGDLPLVYSEPSSNGDGWYTVTGSCDTSEAGRHTLTVVACDRHGNRTTKQFGVTVAAAAPEDTGRDYVLNTSTYKFHYPWCHSLPTSNRSDVHTTRESLISRGYDPCGNCRP